MALAGLASKFFLDPSDSLRPTNSGDLDYAAMNEVSTLQSYLAVLESFECGAPMLVLHPHREDDRLIVRDSESRPRTLT